MWLEAILTRTDIDKIVHQFIPVELRIGDDGHITLDTPTDVTLIADDCVRFVCKAKLHWPIMGMQVPVTIESIAVRLRPEIIGPGGDSLSFKLTLEHVNVAALPKIIDDHITAKINEALVARHVELAWNFRETLSNAFDLPDVLESSSAFALEVKTGVVKVTNDALGFAVSLESAVRRRGAPALMATSLVSTRPGVDRTTDAGIERSALASSNAGPRAALAAGGAFVAVVAAAAFSLGRFSRG